MMPFKKTEDRKTDSSLRKDAASMPNRVNRKPRRCAGGEKLGFFSG
jgi:hypothetical protein